MRYAAYVECTVDFAPAAFSEGSLLFSTFLLT